MVSLKAFRVLSFQTSGCLVLALPSNEDLINVSITKGYKIS